MAKRSRHSFEFKKKVVEEFEKGLGTAQELGRKHGVHPISIYQWKKKFEEGTVVDLPTKRERELEKQLAEAERKIGQLLIERDIFKKLQEDRLREQKRSGGLKSFKMRLAGSNGPAK
jgi:transposase-like protein